jgi:hypothetical protein
MIRYNLRFVEFGLVFLMNSLMQGAEAPTRSIVQQCSSVFHHGLNCLVGLIPSAASHKLRTATRNEIICGAIVGTAGIGGLIFGSRYLLKGRHSDRDEYNKTELEQKLKQKEGKHVSFRKNCTVIGTGLEEDLKIINDGLVEGNDDELAARLKKAISLNEQYETKLIQAVHNIASRFGSRLRNGVEKQLNLIHVTKDDYTKRNGTHGDRDFIFYVNDKNSLFQMDTIKNGLTTTYTVESHPGLLAKLNTALHGNIDPTLKKVADHIVSEWKTKEKRQKLISDIKTRDTECARYDDYYGVTLKVAVDGIVYGFGFKKNPWNLAAICLYDPYSFKCLRDKDKFSAVHRYLGMRWKDKGYSATITKEDM